MAWSMAYVRAYYRVCPRCGALVGRDVRRSTLGGHARKGRAGQCSGGRRVRWASVPPPTHAEMMRAIRPAR